MYHVETCMFYVCLYLDSIIYSVLSVYLKVSTQLHPGGLESWGGHVWYAFGTCITYVSTRARQVCQGVTTRHAWYMYYECITSVLRTRYVIHVSQCIRAVYLSTIHCPFVSVRISVHQGHPLDDTCIKTCITIVLAPMMVIHSDTLWYSMYSERCA